MGQPQASSKDTPRVAVIGAGYWGRNHVRVFHQLGALGAVVDGSPETRSAMQAQYPGVLAFPSLDALAASGTRVDGAVVSTPASTHEDMTLRVTGLGWHVLVEKPAAQSLAGVERIADAAREAGLVFAVGHLLLHHPALQVARDLIRQGRIGKPLYVTAQRVNLGRVRTDEDVISSLAPHDFSILHWLLGVHAVGAAAWPFTVIPKSRPLCDVAFVRVDCDGGLPAHCHFSWLDPFKRREFVVVGETGMLVFDDMAPVQKLRIHGKSAEPPPAVDFAAFNRAIDVRDAGTEAPEIPVREPLMEQARDFLDCIRARRDPVAGAASAIEVARTMDLVRRNMPA